MKKTLCLLLSVPLALCLLAGCTQQNTLPPDQVTPEISVVTMASIAKTNPNVLNLFLTEDDRLICVGEYEGNPVRAVAHVDNAFEKAFSALDVQAGDYQEKLLALLEGVMAETVENLGADIPAQKELDQLVGKTGRELLDDGYALTGHSYNGEELAYTVKKGVYEFEMTADAVFHGEEIDPDELFPTQKVKSLTYAGIAHTAAEEYAQN